MVVVVVDVDDCFRDDVVGIRMRFLDMGYKTMLIVVLDCSSYVNW